MAAPAEFAGSPELLAAVGRPEATRAGVAALPGAALPGRAGARSSSTGARPGTLRRGERLFLRRRGTEWGGTWSWLSGPWFEAARVSPVHPEWDDPTGKRMSLSLYASLGAHVLCIPLLFLMGNIHLQRLDQTPVPRTMTVTFSAPRGNSPTGPRAERPPAPRAAAAAPRPETPVAPPVKPAVTPPARKAADAPPVKPAAQTPPPTPTDTRSRANDGHRVRETADPKLTPIEPAREKGNTRAGAGTMRVATPKTGAPPPAAPAKAPPPGDELPVTESVAAPGPLVASVAGPVAGSAVSLGDLDGVDFPHSYYLEQIRDKIAGSWNPPVGLARGRRVEATIRFRILRDGPIVEQVIEVPSGVSVFDQAALRAVTDVRKFGPLPDAFPGEFLVVHFQFTYTSP